EVARIEAVLTSATTLGGIKRQVSSLCKLTGIDAVIRGYRNTHRGADRGTDPFYRVRLRHHLDDPGSELAKSTPVIDVGQDNLDLVTAPPADFPVPVADALEPPRDLLEQFVPRGMSQSIVDSLEAIEIDHHQRAVSLGDLVSRKRSLEPFGHAMPVGEAGQGIVFRQPRGIALAFAGSGDILGAAAITQESAAGIKFRLGGNGPPDLVLAIETDGLLDDPRMGIEHERYRALSVGLPPRVGMEQIRDRHSNYLVAPNPDLPGRAFREVGQPPLAVGRPEPSQPAGFEVVEHGEPLPGIGQARRIERS